MLRLISMGIERLVRKKPPYYSNSEFSCATLIDFHKELSSIYNKNESLHNSCLGIRLLKIRTPLDWIDLRSNLFQAIAVQQCEARARHYLDRLDSCLRYNPHKMNIEPIDFD
jgi:hypothetical protein